MDKIKLISRWEVSKYFILQPDEFEIAHFDEHFDPSRPAHIYFILSKQRITFDPENTQIDNQKIKLQFKIQDQNTFKKESIKIKMSINDYHEVKINSMYPYTNFEITDNAKIRIMGKSTYFLENFYPQIVNKDFLDYEIVYIGQSMSSSSSKHVPVLERIQNHNTYQKILQDYNRLHPDKEIFLMFLSFKQDWLLDFPNNPTQESRSKIIDYINNGNYNQQFAFLEASLINFFRPPYNNNFVNKAPNQVHKSLKGLFELNLSVCQIYFGLDSFYPKIYSTHITKSNSYNIINSFQ